MAFPPLFRITTLWAVLGMGAMAATPHKISVIDAENGWPVPLVELTTTGNHRFFTDNAGVVAFDLEEFFGQEIWLSVFSHGYEVPKDGFGYRGTRFVPQPGGKSEIKILRNQLAKRLGRLTGAGLFDQSRKLGEHGDWQDSGATGSDTVYTTPYRGKLFWLWGDTNLPAYPLGLFHTPAAVTDLHPLARPEPPIALPYRYFRDAKGTPRDVAKMPGEGPTWLSGLTALKDKKGAERLVATYVKVKNFLDVYEKGLCEWDDEAACFTRAHVSWNRERDGTKKAPALHPDGHVLPYREATGKEWIYFNGPPNCRIPATYEAWRDPAQWEMVKNPREFRSADGEKVEVASAALAWNSHRQRWVMIVQQKFGKPSFLGEIWYLEGLSPEGPWGPAVKIATHQNYTFYNMQIDPLASSDKILLFEGTYTTLFTDNKDKTPGYDYNQILYRLDLDDPGLKPAQGAIK